MECVKAYKRRKCGHKKIADKLELLPIFMIDYSA